MLEEVKTKWLEKVSKALENGVSAETLGHIGLTLAKFEYNHIIKEQKPLDYERVVNDVKEITSNLPVEQPKQEII